MRPGRRLAALTAGVLLLSGCTSFADTVTARPSSSAPPTSAQACPASHARPDPHRPRVDLDFRLADDLTTVTGTEKVTFTPDRSTDELVFRLVPNGPDTAQAGNRLVVDEVRGDLVGQGRYERAGAADPGGLYVVPLDRRLAAGRSTEVELDFTLTLGSGRFDRLGADTGASWWASGFPLLAWEPGVGWAEDPFVRLTGETAASPVADTRIRVSAPERLTVLMTGDQAEPSAARDGRRTWTSREPVARDVSVAAGDFTTAERTTPDGVRVTTGALPGPDIPADQLADWTVRAIADLEERFGPFPYRTLTVAELAAYGGGIEYPSSILMAAPSRLVLEHEVAHMWFYGMVGNSQYRDPWLDEAFATYAQELLDGVSVDRMKPVLQRPGQVGDAMSEFSGDGAYFDTVYAKGGAALIVARQQAGARAFDAAMRCYVNANAWTIATPEDVARALDDLPAAVDVLTRAGALDADDAPN